MASPILYNGIGSPQSIHKVSTTPQHKIGTRGYLPDGRVFYYGKNASGSALTVGLVHVRPELVANHQELATDESLVNVGALTLPVGSITPGATAVTADQYAEGWLVVTDAGGEAYEYKIRKNSAFTSATADGTVELYDPISVAFDANTTVSFIKNAYDSPQVSNTDQADVLVGVPKVTLPIGSTTAQYGWFQTWGECAVLVDETVAAIGQALTIGTGVAGAVEEDDTATTVSQEPIVGYNIAALVDTEHQMVYLTIRP